MSEKSFKNELKDFNDEDLREQKEIIEKEKKYQEIIKLLENQEYALAIIKGTELMNYKDMESIIKEHMNEEKTKVYCESLIDDKKYGEALVILYTINKYIDEKELIEKAEKKNQLLYEIREGKLIKYLGSEKIMYIPEGITAIGSSSLKNLANLTSIIIPEGITSIGESAFYGCFDLTNIAIPVSITSIGRAAFSECAKLASITVPESVTIIGRDAFFGCRSLSNVIIPNGVTRIESYTFSGCTKLISITIPKSVISIGSFAFDFCANSTIYCEALSMPFGWSEAWNQNNRPVVWGYK